MRICWVSLQTSPDFDAPRALASAGHAVSVLVRPSTTAPDCGATVLHLDDTGAEATLERGMQGAYELSRRVHRTILDAGEAFDYIEIPVEQGLGYVTVREQHLLRTHGATAVGIRLGMPEVERRTAASQLHLISASERQVCVLEDDSMRHADGLIGPCEDVLASVRTRLERSEGTYRWADAQQYVAAVEQLVRETRDHPGTCASGGRATDALVSVVIPFYREPLDVLSAAVESALTQSHEAVELLVVDDGSPLPDKDTILTRVAARDSRIRVLHKPNGGLASARNHAIEAASGDYLLFLDADNELRPEYVETGLRAFARHSDLMAVTPECRHYHKRKGDGGLYRPLPYDHTLAIYRNVFGDAGSMFRTAAFREHGLRYDPDVDIYSDWAIWLDCARLGLRFEPLPRTLFDYRVHGDSMMSTRAFDEHISVLALLIERHAPAFTPEESRRVLTTLADGWGVGACLATLAPIEAVEFSPGRFARTIYGGGFTARILDRAGRAAERSPLVAKLGRSIARSTLRMHRWRQRKHRGSE
ncbi:MAG: glycosyltransferase family 2 protein [Planctomycetes bacterium]|nr:glycosyltransferase family 2 protein [Planctomycetota bacterium]